MFQFCFIFCFVLKRASPFALLCFDLLCFTLLLLPPPFSQPNKQKRVFAWHFAPKHTNQIQIGGSRTIKINTNTKVVYKHVGTISHNASAPCKCPFRLIRSGSSASRFIRSRFIRSGSSESVHPSLGSSVPVYLYLLRFSRVPVRPFHFIRTPRRSTRNSTLIETSQEDKYSNPLWF